MIRVFFGVPESYGNSYWALMGHTGKERKASKGGRAPPHDLVRIGLGKGGAPFLLSPSPFPSPIPTRKGGVLLPVGVGLPLARPLWPAAPSPLAPLYTGAGGHPMTHKLIYGSFLSRVRCPPPPYSTSVISSRSLGEACAGRTSSSSPRRRADEILPQHSAGSEFEGRHRAERV